MIIFTRVNKKHRYIILSSNPDINLLYKYGKFILRNYDYYDEYKKIKYYYIKYVYFNNLLDRIEYLIYLLDRIRYLNYSDKYHREDGPAFIEYYTNGKIKNKSYWLDGDKYSYKNYLLKVKKLV